MLVSGDSTRPLILGLSFLCLRFSQKSKFTSACSIANRRQFFLPRIFPPFHLAVPIPALFTKSSIEGSTYERKLQPTKSTLPIHPTYSRQENWHPSSEMPHVQSGTWHHCPGLSQKVDGYPGPCRIGPQDFCVVHNVTCPVHPHWYHTMKQKCLLCLKKDALDDK